MHKLVVVVIKLVVSEAAELVAGSTGGSSYSCGGDGRDSSDCINCSGIGSDSGASGGGSGY